MNLKELNAQLKTSNKDTLATLGSIKWKNANQFYFSNKKGELIYSIDKKTISDQITFENYSYNLDFNQL